MNNVIGLTGKICSGKSFIADEISVQTGIEVVTFDDNLSDFFTLPLIREFLEGKAKGNLSSDSHLLSKFRNIDRKFKEIEIKVLAFLANRELRKVCRVNEPIIVDSFALPRMRCAHKFGMNCLVKTEEEKRLNGICKRNNFTKDEAERVVGIVDGIVDYSKLKYSRIINNDLEQLPDELAELVKDIRQVSSRDC